MTAMAEAFTKAAEQTDDNQLKEIVKKSVKSISKHESENLKLHDTCTKISTMIDEMIEYAAQSTWIPVGILKKQKQSMQELEKNVKR